MRPPSSFKSSAPQNPSPLSQVMSIAEVDEINADTKRIDSMEADSDSEEDEYDVGEFNTSGIQGGHSKRAATAVRDPDLPALATTRRLMRTGVPVTKVDGGREGTLRSSCTHEKGKKMVEFEEELEEVRIINPHGTISDAVPQKTRRSRRARAPNHLSRRSMHLRDMHKLYAEMEKLQEKRVGPFYSGWRHVNSICSEVVPSTPFQAQLSLSAICTPASNS